MSRSLVKRGLACVITATPPTTTKSTSASVKRSSSVRNRSSGVFSQGSDALTATPGARQRELARLGVHRFDATNALCRRQLEMLADQALVDPGASRLCVERQAVPGRPERSIERVDGGVGAG